MCSGALSFSDARDEGNVHCTWKKIPQNGPNIILKRCITVARHEENVHCTLLGNITYIMFKKKLHRADFTYWRHISLSVCLKNV